MLTRASPTHHPPSFLPKHTPLTPRTNLTNACPARCLDYKQNVLDQSLKHDETWMMAAGSDLGPLELEGGRSAADRPSPPPLPIPCLPWWGCRHAQRSARRLAGSRTSGSARGLPAWCAGLHEFMLEQLKIARGELAR